MRPLAFVAAAASLAVLCAPSRAEEGGLDLEQVLALARSRAPTLLAAEARIEEARGRQIGASVLLRDDPVVEASLGQRLSEPDSFAADVALQQRFELGGGRSARMAGASAGLDRAGAERDEALRLLLRDASLAFYRALHAEERLRLARRAGDLAAELTRAVERRFEADEVPFLDVGMSRSWLARGRAERLAAEAGREAALGELRLLLGMSSEEALSVRGDLRDRRHFDCQALRAEAAQRPARRALEAELREAEADVRLARAEAWPDVGLGARYERDEDDDLAFGLVALELPVFQRGQGLRAEASARSRRLRLALEGVTRAADVEVSTACRGARASRGGSGRARGQRPSAARGDRVSGPAQLRRRTDRPFGVSGRRARRPGAAPRLRGSPAGGGGGADPARVERRGAAMRRLRRCGLDRRARDRGRQRLSRRGAGGAHEEPAAAESPSQGAPAADVVTIDPESLRDLRVTTAPAEARGGGDGVAALGEVGVNEDAYAEISPAIPARVVQWLASPGDRVEAGQPLVVLESSELGKARASHLVARARAVLARQARDRKRELVDDRIAARRELHEAEAELEAAEAELRRGRRAALRARRRAERVRRRKGGETRFTLRSPLAGSVLERQVAQGRVAEPGQTLFRIADLARLWLTVHAYERDAIRVQTDSPARVTFSALPGRTAAGTVVGIGGQVDTSSRTIPIRIDVENPDGALRPGMSATAWLSLGDSGATLVAVPVASLQRTHEGWCVFLPLGEGRFERRKVGRGRDLGDEVEIVAGIQPGESVVVDGAFLLKAEADKAGGEGAQHAH